MDDSEIWKEIHEKQREKRWKNDEESIAFLERLKIPFVVLNKSISHYRIGDFDFWATTGKFRNRKTGKSGRGVRNLVRELSTLMNE